LASAKQRETAILTMTDAHFGKCTKSFNPTVFVERLKKLSKSLERIHTLLGDYAFDELVIAMVGDMVDGTMIYPTQVYHQEITSVSQQLVFLSEYSRSSFSNSAKYGQDTGRDGPGQSRSGQQVCA